MRIFGIDPGSERTGYGCIDSDGSRCQLVARGVISLPSSLRFPDKLVRVFDELVAQLARHRPACVAVEGVFYARNARSALILGQVRGVVLLAAGKAALPVSEYAATAVKSAVVGYGRADKRQVQSTDHRRCCGWRSDGVVGHAGSGRCVLCEVIYEPCRFRAPSRSRWSWRPTGCCNRWSVTATCGRPCTRLVGCSAPTDCS